MPFPLSAAHSRLYYPAGSATPVIPPTTGAVLIVSLYGLGGTGITEGDAFSVNSDGTPQTIQFVAAAPYAADFDALETGGSPPYLVDEWNDQLP